MNIKFTQTAVGILAASVAVLAGCGGSGSGSEEAGTTGFLSLGVSDGPVHDADKVCITFNEVEVKGSGDSTVITLDPPQKINLLDFQGDNAMPILTQEELEAGDYEWMRLGVDAVRDGNGGDGETYGEECDGAGSYLVMKDSTETYNLYVPSGENTGLKLVGGFTVPANDTTYLTAEFDIAKSITAPPGQSPDMILRPTIRLVNNVDVGTLTGLVESSDESEPVPVFPEDCDPSVYVFNDGVPPNPIGIDDDPESTEIDPNDPIATAMVSERTNDDGSVQWDYTVGFLLAGDYEAAFTCGDGEFVPVDGKEAAIFVNEVTTVSFEYPPTE